jgi:hypothetical protein
MDNMLSRDRFKNPAVAALMGAGNVLPIRRGGRVDQPLDDSKIDLDHRIQIAYSKLLKS